MEKYQYDMEKILIQKPKVVDFPNSHSRLRSGQWIDQFIQINVIISMWSYQCNYIIMINFHFTPTQILQWDQNTGDLLPYFEQVYSDILR